MKAVWRSPYSKVQETLLVGSTTFIVEGLYSDGMGETPLSGGGAVAPCPPDFEIESIHMLIQTPKGDIPIDVTKLLEDVNSITWNKECKNCFFEFLSNKVIDNVSQR